VPGFFHSIRASLSDIPRNQPIRDDLEWLAERSARAKRMREILEGMSDDVDAAIESALETLPSDALMTADHLRTWRNAIHEKAANSSGFTYGPYVELKTSRALNSLTRHLSDATHARPGASPRATIADYVDRWALEKGLKNLGRIKPVQAQDEAPAWLDFLAKYDLSYRIRRLRFVIRRLNALYADVPKSDIHPQIDTAKVSIYAALSALVIKNGNEWMPEKLRGALRDGLNTHSSEKSDILQLYQDALALKSEDAAVDTMISSLLATLPSEVIRTTIVRSYLGFAFYDIAMLPVLQSDDLDEFDAIKVDRIAPEDCTSLSKGRTDATLKGVRFGNFGAFFSRAYRENDYLWGRLHGAERMIDILISSLPAGVVSETQQKMWKRDIFRRIIDRERAHLKTISPLFDQLERDLAHLT
jgi:patatin-related protein